MNHSSDSTQLDQLERIRESLRERARSLGCDQAAEDREAWREFFQRYDRILRRFAKSAGCDDAALDDVVCNVWLDVLQYLPTYDHEKSGGFRRWLYRWVFRRVIDDVRRRKPRTRQESSDVTTGFWLNVVAPQADAERDPLERLLRREFAEAVWEEFRQQATEREVEVVRQGLFGDDDAAAIGARLALTETNVRKIKSRGLVRLRVIAAELFGGDI